MKFKMLISIKIYFIYFLGSDKPGMQLCPLINVKMPTNDGILIFMSMKKVF